jgi:hypothetical protein
VSGIHHPTLKVSGSDPHGCRNKKIFSVAKEDYECFISIKYVNLCSNILKKRDEVGAQNETTRT